MANTVDQHLADMQHDHARWSAEHGHWRKALRIWEEEHAKAIGICSNIELLVKKFDALFPIEQRNIILHEEEVRLHSKELEHAVKGSKHPGEELHKCGVTEHQKEQEAYIELQALHQSILDEIECLKAIFPERSCLVSSKVKADVERVAEV